MYSNFKNTGVLAIASFLAASSVVGVAGVAEAHSMHKSAVSSSTVTDDPTANAVRAWRGGPINVMSTAELNSAEAQSISDADQLDPSQLSALRAAIKSNRGLEQALAKQNISVNDVAGADVATDGGIVFYTM